MRESINVIIRTQIHTTTVKEKEVIFGGNQSGGLSGSIKRFAREKGNDVLV